jgi:hypothetical protein
VLEALLHRIENGRDTLLQQRVLGTAIPAALSSSQHSDAFSWDNDYYFHRTGTKEQPPNRWLPGPYRLDLFLNNEKVSSGTFSVE